MADARWSSLGLRALPRSCLLGQETFLDFLSLSLLYGVFPGLLGQRIRWRIRGERPEKYWPRGIMRPSFAEAAAGYSNKDSSIEKKKTKQNKTKQKKKNTERARDDGKRKKAWASLPLFPLSIVPRALSLFPIPSLPTTQRGFCVGERPRFINLSANDDILLAGNPWLGSRKTPRC